MAWTLAHIFRHPVKSLGEEELESADLRKGRSIAYDRRWAVAHGEADAVHGWAGPKNFVTQTHVPKLAQIRCHFRPESHLLHLSHPDLPDIAFQPGSVEGDDMLAEWLEPLVKGTTRSGPFLVYERPDGAFTDFIDTDISIGSEASRRALGQRAGQDLAHIRFRMNLWLEGLAPWEELDLVGREIEIGEARLMIIRRDKRCNATAASPMTGNRDVQVPAILNEQFGHMDFGVYATVSRGGTIRPGDEVRPL